MKVNDIYEINIIDDNHNGNGIGKIDGFPVFVKGTVCGDIVKVRIVRVLKKYAVGEVVSFISKSGEHVMAQCPYYDKCGGCNLMHVSYDREVLLKKRYLNKLFKDKFDDFVFWDRFNYRNKVKFHVVGGKLGFYDESSNDLIYVSSCMLICDEVSNFIKIFDKIDLSGINEITVRKGDNGLLLYILGSISFNDLEKIKSCKEVISIYENDNLVYGDSFIMSSIGNVKYFINHKAFFQINSECCYHLYEEIKRNVLGDSLLDLYCGTGSIGIYVSDVCKNVVGVEVNPESVKCANKNIKINNIDNYEVILGDASVICDKFDTVVVDPPRSGLSKDVISNINSMRAKRLIYVSCNPSTLKRDIELLINYELISVKGFNMFPCTKHVECLCVLDLK